jgi:hypothetical protein
MFERRLGLFPAFFDADGIMHVYTDFGDLPYRVPDKKIASPDELFPGWMLLSYNKPVQVSSELTDYPAKFAADEEIRTFWSAKSGDKGEWISIDLQKQCTVHAIQINYAENETKILGRQPDIHYQYLLEYSTDQKNWNILIDKTKNTFDVPHDYIEITTPVKARYLRLTNYKMADGLFALAGLRVFGNNGGNAPSQIENLICERDTADPCIVKLSWKKVAGAVGYNIRYGNEKDKLYHHYQVIENDSVTIRSLHSQKKYYFTMDVFNENGITKGNKVIEVK